MKSFLTLLTIMIYQFGFSQNSNFTLGVILPEVNSKINEQSISRLDAKLINFLNRSQVFSYGYSNDFMLYPKVDIVESETVQGGLENITVVKTEISFIIKQLSTGKTFGSAVKIFKGSGKDEKQALINSFSKISPTDNVLHYFLNEARNNIEKYYTENCSKIIQEADNYSKIGNYEQSIAILQSIPSTVESCYDESRKKSISYFVKFQEKSCKNNIIKAKTEIASNNFEKAAYYLNLIDSESVCYTDAEKLISDLSSKIEKRDNEELDLEKRRLSAIEEIGKAYFSEKASRAN